MWPFVVIPLLCGVGILGCFVAALALCRSAAAGDRMDREVYDQERDVEPEMRARQLAPRTRGCTFDRSVV
jgi:hypothetical protein